MIARHFINNKELSPAIVNQFDVKIKASFENDEVQANLASTEFQFILEAFEEIKKHYNDGKIFEPLPYKILAVDGSNQLEVFNGNINLQDNATFNPFSLDVDVSDSVNATIEQADGLNTFFERLEAIDFDFLNDKKALSEFINIDYVVENYYSPIELILISAQIYSFTSILIENSYKIQEATSNFIALVSTPPGGSIGATVYAGLQLLALLAYQALIGLALLNLVNAVKNTYALPKRDTKGQTLGTLFRDCLRYLGYDLQTDISELDTYAIIPSNPNLDTLSVKGFISTPQGTKKGYPNIRDVGNNCLDFVNQLKSLFNAKIGIEGTTVFFYRTLSDFWRKDANYQLPSIQPQPFKPNTEQIKANYAVTFAYDPMNDFNFEESEGFGFVANYESFTEPNNIRGREPVNIPYQLGSRKERLNPLEALLNEFFGTVESVLSVFGQSFNSRFTDKIGALKVSTNNWTLPILIPLQGSKVASNPRQKLSSKYLWENYHFDKSPLFEGRQRLLFESVEIPFGMADFIKLINNSYIGNIKGKVINIDWNINSDTATIDYYQEFLYTDRIRETLKEID